MNNLWIGVSDMIHEEDRERVHANFKVFIKWMRDRQGIKAELIIRESELFPEIFAQVRDDREIGVFVFSAGTGKKGPIPLVVQLMKKFWLSTNTNHPCTR